MILGRYRKQPAERLKYAIDYQCRGVGTCYTIDTLTYTVGSDEGDATVNPTLVVDELAIQSADPTKVDLIVSSGTAGVEYRIDIVAVVTPDNLTFQDTVFMQVEEVS